MVLPDSLGAGVPTVGTTTRFTRPRHFGLLPRTPTTTSPFAGCWATTIWHHFLLWEHLQRLVASCVVSRTIPSAAQTLVRAIFRQQPKPTTALACSLKTKVGVTAMAAPSPKEPATVTVRPFPKVNAIVRAMWRTLVASVEVTVQVVKDAPIRPLAILTPQL